MLGNRKLFEKTIRMMSQRFRPQAGYASLAELFDKCLKFQPNIFSADEVYGLALSEVFREDMVVLVLKDTKPNVISIRDPDTTIKSEETMFVNRPSGISVTGGNVLKPRQGSIVFWNSILDVQMKFVNIHNDC
jgi:hypothetical protein